MEDRFLDLWARLGCLRKPDHFYQEIQEQYSEPFRKYHTLNHINFCLDEFHSVRNLLQDPNAVEFAIWYHDIIYDLSSEDNVEESAKLASQRSMDAWLGKSFSNKVNDLIIATKHDKVVQDNDTKYLLDIDLSILGQDDKIYDEYDRNICLEYQPVINVIGQEAFNQGRKRVLSYFLNKDSIYQTNYFRWKYHSKARENLERSILSLS